MSKKAHGQFTDDHHYHKLFSKPETITDLIKTIQPQLLAELDLASLTHISGEFLSADMRARRSDVIWKVRWRNHDDCWLYVYLLLEFKSRQERFCILQVLEYLVLAYQDLVSKKQLSPNNKLPPILPIVLYNGDKPWQQPKNLGELIENGPTFFQPFAPTFNLFVIDENDYQDAPLEANNLVSAIFKFENAGLEALPQVLQAMSAWFHSHENQALKDDLTTWLKYCLKNVLDADTLNVIYTFEDLSPMFATRYQENLAKFQHDALLQGIEQGIEQGLERGLIQGKRLTLKRLANQHFGVLPAWAETHIEEVNASNLDTLMDKLLCATTLEDWLLTKH
jgi:hypothetical protein